MPASYEMARSLQRAGKSKNEVIEALIDEGMDLPSARVLANSVFTGVEASANAAQNRLQGSGYTPSLELRPDEQHLTSSSGGGMSSTAIIGLVLIAVGILITIGTLATAAPGGTYIIAFGPVIAGVRMLIRGSRGR